MSKNNLRALTLELAHSLFYIDDFLLQFKRLSLYIFGEKIKHWKRPTP